MLNAADLFVLSSGDRRHAPGCMGEALACGCPVVATDAAGVAALLGDCGTIVSRGDAQVLATAIGEVLGGRPRRGGRAGRARHERIVSRFSLEAGPPVAGSATRRLRARTAPAGLCGARLMQRRSCQ
ncbi:glycosyltransferase [Cupriavidus basilensis]